MSQDLLSLSPWCEISVLWGLHTICCRTPWASCLWRLFVTLASCLGSLSCCRMRPIRCLPDGVVWQHLKYQKPFQSTINVCGTIKHQGKVHHQLCGCTIRSAAVTVTTCWILSGIRWWRKLPPLSCGYKTFNISFYCSYLITNSCTNIINWMFFYQHKLWKITYKFLINVINAQLHGT